MPCVLVVLALMVPRLVLAVLWVFTDYFGRVFESWLWPVVGFVFMPYTTVAYVAAKLNSESGVSGWWLVLIILAVMADVGAWGGSGRRGRERLE